VAVVLRVPQEELKRVAEANTTLLTIARDLAALAVASGAASLADKLLTDSTILLDTAKTIDSALRAAIYTVAA
jgi:hypothetical protein